MQVARRGAPLVALDLVLAGEVEVGDHLVEPEVVGDTRADDAVGERLRIGSGGRHAVAFGLGL